MGESSEAPPGLEALANHLGYTFIKKASDSSNSSESGDSAVEVEKKDDEKDEKAESEEPEVATGSKTSYTTIYKNEFDDTWTKDVPKYTEPAEGKDTLGHAIVIRQQKSTDSRKKYEIHSIVVQSPALKTALGEILDGYPGICCNMDRLVFKAPFEPFVHRWGTFLEYIKKEGLDTVTKEHMELLHEVLKKELGDTIKAFEDYVANGVLTHEHAWIVFQPDAVVVSTSGPGETIALRMKNGAYADGDKGKIYAMNCQRVDWNGKSFGWADEYIELPEFSGTQPISELDVFPLEFHPRKEEVMLDLIERGKRFAALAGYHYKAYDGPAIERTSDGNNLVHNTGRIIIDTNTFCKQPDQCKIYTVPLSSPSSTRIPTFPDEMFFDPYNDNPPPPFKTDANTELTLREPSDQDVAKLTDYQYMLCTPILRGYSIKSKKWLSFFVDHVQEIQWDNQAFSGLVLPAAQKKLILALSKQAAAATSTFDDIVSGKGKGMILLLSGPPGVGKTLTAEAVSENMRVPLYMMSAGDLGIRAEEVEENLEGILEMVAKWKAILLIDECDVFLEARSINDIKRNQLVSIFLRLLEYYSGTLFLTTNRVDNIDPAFNSRIHVHMRYKELTRRSRKQIWKSMVERVGGAVSEEELEELSEVELNGRQIKNVVKTAGLLAGEEGVRLGLGHVDLVLGIEKGFEEDEE